MKSTVAIIGSHPGTRSLFDFERTDCDVWAFNEAMSQDWCKRADAIFQMHKPVVWRSATNRNDPKHYDWLSSGDTPTIYMQEQFEDVPKSVQYPFRGIQEAFSATERYFTSSVSYAFALAVYQGYERIEVYGVEMETGTEYFHQRVAIAYWVGFAAGRGIEVVFNSPTFFKAPLYGYDGDVRIDADIYRNRIDKLKEAQGKAQKAHNIAIETLNGLLNSWIKDWKTDLSRLDDVIVACGQTGHNFGMVDGALQTNEQYLERCEIMLGETGDYLIVRQELEGKTYAGMQEQKQRLNETYGASAVLSEKRVKFMTNANKDVREKITRDFMASLNQFIKVSTLTGIGTGIMTENRNLMMLYDRLLSAQGLIEMPVVQEVEAV